VDATGAPDPLRGQLRGLVVDALRDPAARDQALAGQGDETLAAAWAAAGLDGLLTVVCVREPRGQVIGRCVELTAAVVGDAALVGKTAAQRARVALIAAGLAAARGAVPRLEQVALARQLHAVEYKPKDEAERAVLGVMARLLALVALPPEADRARFATAVAVLAAHLDVHATARASEAARGLRSAHAAPTIAELRAGADPPAPPLTALVDAMLGGPTPLAAHLASAGWTAASLADAWRGSDELRLVLALPALHVEHAALRMAVVTVLGALDRAVLHDSVLGAALPALGGPTAPRAPWRRMTSPLAPPLRWLTTSASGFVRAHGAARLGALLGKDAALADRFRAALAASPDELLGWLGLFAEASQAGAAAALAAALDG